MTRRSLVLLIASLLLLATGVLAWRERTAVPPPRPGEVLEAGGGLAWQRGNLHAHSLWSDGDAPAAEVAGWYRRHGYAFLALTDHDTAGDDDAWQALARGEQRPGAFVLLRGEEVSNDVAGASVHVNAIGIDRTVARPGGATVVAAIERTAARVHGRSPHALVQVNHPNAWFSLTAEQLMQQRGTNLFEVYNGHPLSNVDGDGLRPSTERLWDIALAWRLDVLGLPLLYGTATDDSHAFRDGSGRAGAPGRGWVMVLAAEPAAGAILQAIASGRFYASTGVGLERIVATSDRLEVEVATEPGVDYTIEFIGTRRGFDPRSEPPQAGSGRAIYGSRRHSSDIGLTFKRVAGPRGAYSFGADDLYVRARVTSSRRHPDPGQPLQFERAWVQPVAGPAGRAPGRPGLAPPPAAAPKQYAGITRRFGRLAPAAADALLATSFTGCSLDLLAGGDGRPSARLRRRDRAMLGGWIADPAAAGPPDSLTVVLRGETAWEAAAGTARARPDVAKALGKPAFEGAGFTVDFALANVVPGDYAIWLVAHYGDRALACDAGRSLRVD